MEGLGEMRTEVDEQIKWTSEAAWSDLYILTALCFISQLYQTEAHYVFLW